MQGSSRKKGSRSRSCQSCHQRVMLAQRSSVVQTDWKGVSSRHCGGSNRESLALAEFSGVGGAELPCEAFFLCRGSLPPHPVSLPCE